MYAYPAYMHIRQVHPVQGLIDERSEAGCLPCIVYTGKTRAYPVCATHGLVLHSTDVPSYASSQGV